MYIWAGFSFDGKRAWQYGYLLMPECVAQTSRDSLAIGLSHIGEVLVIDALITHKANICCRTFTRKKGIY